MKAFRLCRSHHASNCHCLIRAIATSLTSGCYSPRAYTTGASKTNESHIVRYVYESKHSTLVYSGTLLVDIQVNLPIVSRVYQAQWQQAADEARPVGDYLAATGAHGYYSLFSVLSTLCEVQDDY